VAVMLEPVQGEGGIRPANKKYLQELREICNDNNWLMIMDEIQTGIGRTGKMFAFHHADIIPDVLLMAKALGNGIPIGACFIARKYCELFKPGSHGTTFGGNPLSCTAALSIIDIIEKNALCANAQKHGDFIKNSLSEKLGSHPNVIEVRGKGLMIGVEVDKPCRDILKLALEEGIVFNIANEKVIRLLPPLIIDDNIAQDIVSKIVKLVNKYFS